MFLITQQTTATFLKQEGCLMFFIRRVNIASQFATQEMELADEMLIGGA
jgi:hypothetical protein